MEMAELFAKKASVTHGVMSNMLDTSLNVCHAGFFLRYMVNGALKRIEAKTENKDGEELEKIERELRFCIREFDVAVNNATKKGFNDLCFKFYMCTTSAEDVFFDYAKYAAGWCADEQKEGQTQKAGEGKK